MDVANQNLTPLVARHVHPPKRGRTSTCCRSSRKNKKKLLAASVTALSSSCIPNAVHTSTPPVARVCTLPRPSHLLLAGSCAYVPHQIQAQRTEMGA